MLSNLHNIFRVSQLRKYVYDPSHVVEPDTIQIKDNLTFETSPVRIEDRKTKQLRGKEINLVKVLWSGTHDESATWELEWKIKELYRQFFVSA